MNDSGMSVQAFANFYKIKAEEILIIHDEFRKISVQKLTSFAKERYVLYDVKYLLEKKYVDGRL